MERVGVIVLDDVVLFDLATPVEVFNRAKTADGDAAYDVVTLGKAPANARVATVTPTHALDTRVDTMVIPGRHDPEAPTDPRVLAAVRRAATTGTRLLSVCTGAFTLAEAGVLDSRRATTHWLAADALARLYPRIDVDPSVLFVDEGDVMTSAGAVAGVDLCLHVVRTDHGAVAAADAARMSVAPPLRDGGQAQFIPAPRIANGSSLAPVLEWINAHLHEPLSVEQVAEAVAITPRTLHRRFVEQVAATPAAWIAAARVRRAQELLETSNLTTDVIAARVGFGSADTLRRRFRSQVGMSPSSYRARFSHLHAAGGRTTPAPT